MAKKSGRCTAWGTAWGTANASSSLDSPISPLRAMWSFELHKYRGKATLGRLCLNADQEEARRCPPFVAPVAVGNTMANACVTRILVWSAYCLSTCSHRQLSSHAAQSRPRIRPLGSSRVTFFFLGPHRGTAHSNGHPPGLQTPHTEIQMILPLSIKQTAS